MVVGIVGVVDFVEHMEHPVAVVAHSVDYLLALVGFDSERPARTVYPMLTELVEELLVQLEFPRYHFNSLIRLLNLWQRKR